MTKEMIQIEVDRLNSEINEHEPEIYVFPASSVQKRLWLLDQLKGDSAIYNISTAINLHGQLDLGALQKSLQELTSRHEILRTKFPLIDNSPVQAVFSEVSLPLELIDLQSFTSEQQIQEAQQITIAESHASFQLDSDCLWRCKLLRFTEKNHVLLITMHHTVADGWSMGIFIQELSRLYHAYLENQPSPLADLPIQYGDFAEWQYQYLQSDNLTPHLHYWKKKLANALPLVDLPTDKPRSAVQSFQGAKVRIKLSQSATKSLKLFSSHQDVTLFTTLITALNLLLFKWTSQTDLVIGTVVSGRDKPELAHLIGCFVNFLALRSQITGEQTIVELLQQVNQTVIEAYTHQDCPFEKVVEALNPERQLSHNPIYNVALLLQNFPIPPFFSDSLDVQYQEIETDTALLDLRFIVYEVAEELLITCEYSTDIFNLSTIKRMLNHLQIILENLPQKTTEKIANFSILTEAEKHKLLGEWNNTQANYPVNQCIHQLFEAQVQKTPNAVAVVFENQHLTYQEVDHRAHQLASHLQSLGVGPDILVGLCVERSLLMVIGLLGILKAGGAYVPIDPDYPPERREFIVTDAMMSVLLTQAQFIPEFAGTKATIIDLEREFFSKNIQDNHPLKSEVQPHNLAYVIYTSGSTGKPKGVLINHQNVVRLLAATQAWFNFNEQDVWTLFHSYAFDFSVWELWGALSYGGRVVVVPYWISRSFEAFYQLLIKEQVTVLNQTPSAFRQLIQVDETAGKEAELSLRWVIFGGEALEIKSLRPWFEKHGEQKPQLVNMYGITETTVHVTYRPLSYQDLERSSSVIGCAIPDLQIYILDQYQQPVPVGVRGEMYVGGAGLARGYWQRAELTAERFIPHPFREGEKLYRTGDLARYLENGDIEYLGRIDHQVKIRGFRIELGEIEAMLAAHPDIQEVIVIVREDIPGQKRLVAYLVSDLTPDRLPYQQDCLIKVTEKTFPAKINNIALGGVGLIEVGETIAKGTEIEIYFELPKSLEKKWLKGKVAWSKSPNMGIEFYLDSQEKEIIDQSFHYLLETKGFLKVTQRMVTKMLRNYLTEKLPDYMIPSAFVLIEALPLTPNGKIDRRALPVPDRGVGEADNFLPPSTDTEKELAKIWCEVLNLEKVGIQDNFFELGGHSLLATQVMSRLRQTFAIDLPLRILFEYPTIAKLGECLDYKQLEQFQGEDLDAILTQVEQLSEEEVKQLLE